MTKNGYKFRGPNTWALAREAYLSGETAASVARRFDLTVSSMRRRMRLEGWSRRDHAAALDAPPPRRASEPTSPRLDGAARAAPEPDTPPGATLRGRPSARDLPETTAAELLRRTLRQAADALDEGRTADARTLSQMAESLSRTAARDPKTSLETILRALRDTAFRTELFRIDPDAADDPDLPVKRAYWGLDGGGG